ncbi:hypothetical protein DUNSADRAFT_15851 [Dunaliella salina]|uniref:Methyltransferase domain-containing protein n=1 Tax=Dunaliella salina TaxID=3046 RepID=A0ABQ7G4U1_DUNSA|nr:hypothetical protein DUNSADRAFT_15851 [Dunaliella salina]|eukprot:KAF5829611.1 hypothetical protein DUNSADRAFT_15851 [Dunaliella salina]
MAGEDVKKEGGKRNVFNSTTVRSFCPLVSGPAVLALMLCFSFSFNPKKTNQGPVSKEGECVGEAWWKDAQCFSACTQASSETSLTQNVSWKGISCYKCLGWNGADPIFDYVETLHGANEPWGAVLDAGTGPNSYPWLLSLPGKTRCDAVTASHSMARLAAAGASKSGNKGPVCNMHVRSWMHDADFLEGQFYDNIIMDYLIGGRLWIIGLEPFPHRDILPAHVSPDLVAVAELRDTAIALSGERPYREFPLLWYHAALQGAGLKHLDATAGFANLYSVQWASHQLREAWAHLQKCKHAAACEGLKQDVKNLEERLKREWGRTERCFGMNFVIAAGW